MKITKWNVKNFSCFEKLSVDFSSQINVIIGENSSGKTHILKSLYSIVKTIDDLNIENKKSNSFVTKEHTVEMLTNKLTNVYKVEKVGRLVKRSVGRGKSELILTLDNNKKIEIDFSRLASSKVNIDRDLRELKFSKHSKPVYLPPKEIISATENFAAIYDEYHIAFEETYADLCKQLLLPNKKGPNSDMQNKLLDVFEGTVEGKIVRENNIFSLQKPGDGKYEMGLVAEGYRKFATIIQLIQNGVLDNKSILFWDEPETNINPKLISATAEVIMLLADLGVQVFITTHSYFLIKELNLMSKKEKKVNFVQFHSLYKKDDIMQCESATDINDIEQNVIEDEFLNLYNKEQEYFYDID